MPEQALYLKWRPYSFEDVVGQEHVIHTLKNSLKTGRMRHAYLFSGPRGTGKTTCARLLAKAINCHNEDPNLRPCNDCPACHAVNEGRYLDLIEIDAATHTGVDDVRDLRDKIAFTPGEGQYKVYIIDEVHRFTGNAFDALLKTLEEPPPHAIFVLATTEIDKVPATIKSRCLQFEFRRLSLQELTERLALITETEGMQIEPAALEVIARQATGSVRDSISLLDQIVADPQEVITLDLVQRILGTANTQAVRELVDAIVEQHTGHGLHIINAAVDSGSDPRQFGQQVVDHLRAVLLAQTASADLVEASEEERALYQEQAGKISRGALLRTIRTFNEAINSYRGGWQPQLTLELALIESLHHDEVFVPQMVTSPGQTQAPAKPAEAPIEPVEATPPGAPPVIAPSIIQERWGQFLKALSQYSSNGPALLQHYRVQRVDGNLVYLCTDNDLYFSRLHQQPAKLNALERALHDVHRVPMRVQVTLVDNMDQASSASVDQTASDLDVDDPLLATSLELGGQISSDDNEIDLDEFNSEDEAFNEE